MARKFSSPILGGRKEVDTEDFDNTLKFRGCDTCINGVVTKIGVVCGKNLALTCKPDLLETPKFYKNWESINV